jgi:hypothetical protein
MDSQTVFISDSEPTAKKGPRCWGQAKKVVSAVEAAYKARQASQVWGCEQPDVKAPCTALVPYQAPTQPNLLQAVVEWVRPRIGPALVTVALLTLRLVVAALIWLLTEPRSFLDRHHQSICTGVGVTAYYLGRAAFYVYGACRLVWFWAECWLVLARA